MPRPDGHRTSIGAARCGVLTLAAVVALTGPAGADKAPASVPGAASFLLGAAHVAQNLSANGPMRPKIRHDEDEMDHPDAAALTRLVAFEATPFPYRGAIPGQDVKFLDVSQDGRNGHMSPRGGVYWEDQTYSDKHVLLSIPHGVDFSKPVLLVLFMHGNLARLARDVWHRQQVPQQVAGSALNAVLVAPQFALDALDSSAGHFWEHGFLKTFLAETSTQLASLSGDPRAKSALDQARVVIVAYSGGYLPAAYSLQGGGDGERIAGVVLLDGLYGEEQRMADWVVRRGSALFFSAYSPSTRTANEGLETLLKDQNITILPALPATLQPGSVTFLRTPLSVVHNDFLTQAWTKFPLQAVLTRIEGYGR